LWLYSKKTGDLRWPVELALSFTLIRDSVGYIAGAFFEGNAGEIQMLILYNVIVNCFFQWAEQMNKSERAVRIDRLRCVSIFIALPGNYYRLSHSPTLINKFA